VDQTKTKAGKDFFDKFYSTYNLRNEKYPFIATVNELPEFGRSSFIQIEENEKILYKFRAIPNEEYIEQQVEITLKILNQYQSERQLLQRELSAP
jgi:Curli assembly protein CsgE.